MPAKVVYEDDELMAFNDINPKAETHVLVIPKKHISSLSEMEEADSVLFGKALYRIKLLADELGVGNSFNVVVNNGKQAGQLIPHLHFHLLSGWKNKGII